MFIVYIIKSKQFHWYYVGMTSDLSKRLRQHNEGRVKSTKHRKPYELVYTKDFLSRVEARDHEKFLKVRSNKEKALLTI